MYRYIREDLDESYKIKEKIFNIDTIKTIRIKASTRNFLKIMKALTKDGPCTAKQITLKYHDPDQSDRFRGFQNTYHRIIIGNDEFPGLIKKGIIEPVDPDWKSKRNNQFRLTLFGILYSIRLFCEPILHSMNIPRIRIRKDSDKTPIENSVIHSLIGNYSDNNPLIFGKWKFFESNLEFLSNILIFIAHYAPRPTDFQYYPFFDSSSLDLREWKRNTTPNQDEFALLFLGYLFLGMKEIQRKFHSVISKDNEIYSFYEKHLSLLDKIGKIRQSEIKVVHDTLTGNFPKIPKKNKRKLDIRGRPTNTEISKQMEF